MILGTNKEEDIIYIQDSFTSKENHYQTKFKIRIFNICFKRRFVKGLLNKLMPGLDKHRLEPVGNWGDETAYNSSRRVWGYGIPPSKKGGHGALPWKIFENAFLYLKACINTVIKKFQ